MKKLLFISGLISVLIWSCEEPNSEAEIISYSLKDVDADVEIQPGRSQVKINFPEAVTRARGLVADFEISEGSVATINSKVQESGISGNNFEQQFSILITAEDEITVKSWNVIPQNNNYTPVWGMGGFLSSSLSNNRTYEWYIDQAGTGQHSGNNCGPTTTVMASLWSDPSYSNSPADARATYRSEGGWWYTDDISNYLDDNGIPNRYIHLGQTRTETATILKQELDQGSLAILCLDMYYVASQENPEFRTNKFYHTENKDWGHFMLVKGYREVDGELYWEAYDSNSWGKKYKDGTPKGLDRYYHSKEIQEATTVWWNYAIIVSEKGKKSTIQEELDPSQIPHAHGR